MYTGGCRHFAAPLVRSVLDPDAKLGAAMTTGHRDERNWDENYRDRSYRDEPRQDQSYRDESYNPWSVVHAVFTHLVDAGLHPVLGESGDPEAPARELLRALGVTPDASGNREVKRAVHAHLAEIRAAVFEDG